MMVEFWEIFFVQGSLIKLEVPSVALLHIEWWGIKGGILLYFSSDAINRVRQVTFV